MQLFSALAFISLAVAVYLVGDVVTQPGRERDRAVRRAANYGRNRVSAHGARAPALHRAGHRPRDRLARTASR